jgi:cellulose biosynthesis protein BcsQ
VVYENHLHLEPKGGSGKSTLTVHLAVAAEMAGDGPALITDTGR